MKNRKAIAIQHVGFEHTEGFTEAIKSCGYKLKIEAAMNGIN